MIDKLRQHLIVFKLLDLQLITLIALLMSIGMLIMTSASIDYALHKFGFEFHYAVRQLVFAAVGFIAASFILVTPMTRWSDWSWACLLLGLLLLVAVLIPGIGREVNGSMRWIPLGPVNLQSSELAKVCIMIYLASYLVRRQKEIRETWLGFIKPIIVMSLMIILLLCEPDFGSAVVLIIATMGMIFLGGVGLKQFITIGIVALTAVVLMAVSSDYRMARLKCFIDPWEFQFDCGYQLTQALIAFGRGDFSGLGLGNSIQKLFYLPEAHTDFVFAILAEELGFIGAVFVLITFALLIAKIFSIAAKAQANGQFFNAYLAYGIALVIASQVFINIGVNTGLLPTKGLTLPFFSYGGSSLIMAMVMMGFVNRIAIEAKVGGESLALMHDYAVKHVLIDEKKMSTGLVLNRGGVN
ncbi:MAG: putative lipid II flippase FtsW [Sinobacterium sp.]|nr:putative lipid II flippase FtsW [Sinobacterium sp.]